MRVFLGNNPIFAPASPLPSTEFYVNKMGKKQRWHYNLNLTYGYALCQKSRYFSYGHLSEDLNDPKSTDYNENREASLKSEPAV